MPHHQGILVLGVLLGFFLCPTTFVGFFLRPTKFPLQIELESVGFLLCPTFLFFVYARPTYGLTFLGFFYAHPVARETGF